MNAPPTVIEEISAEPTVVDGFGDDALGRVQGLLFGDHAQRTNDRLDSIEQTLFDMISELRSSIDVQLGQLTDQLSTEVQTRDDAVSELGSRVTQEVKALTKADNALGRKLEKTTENLRDRIAQAGDKASTELAAARHELTAEIDGVQDRKVERATLAALLRATANDLDS